MKVLFSITYYHPYVSGLTLAAARWAQGLAKAGDQVTVLAMQHDKTLPLSGRINKVSIHRVPWIFNVSKGFVSFDWLITSWRETREYDVVVVNLPQFEGILPALFAKLQGKRVVSVYHCEIVLPPSFINSVIQSFVELSHVATLLLSDAVVTYTSDYARHSKLLTLLRRRVSVTAIVPPIPKPGENQALTNRLEKEIGKADVAIGVAARLAAEKGIEYLLESIPMIKRKVKNKTIKIVIAGPIEPVGEAAYRVRIMKLVRKYKKYVVFLGQIKPDEMGSFYRLIDVLVLPSINSTEAFGMVQVEAMRYGLPVVASDLPGVRVPIQRTGMGRLVDPRDRDGIAAAISQVACAKERYRAKKADFFPPSVSIASLQRLLAFGK